MKISGYSKNLIYSTLQYSLRIVQENSVPIDMEAITTVVLSNKKLILFFLKQSREQIDEEIYIDDFKLGISQGIYDFLMHYAQLYSLIIDQDQTDLLTKCDVHEELYQPNLGDELFSLNIKFEIRTAKDDSSINNIVTDDRNEQSTNLAGDKITEEQII